MKLRLIICLLFACMVVAPTASEAAKFKDVKDSHSLQYEIEYLVEQGVISGYPDKTFKPNAPIAKKHVASMVVKALDLPTTNVKNPGYKDVPTTHPYYKDIAAGYTAGLFSKAEKFNPNATISRAYMAQLLTKALKLQQNGEAIDFKDVKKSSQYYKAIQAVATNNIAKGSYDGDYNSQFKPNGTLTRAHFSAFLARAMTLNDGDYMPLVGYNYLHQTSDGERVLYENVYDDHYGGYYWIGYDFNAEEIDRSVYGNHGSMWFEGVPESDVGYFVEHPFTIGLKYDELDFDGPSGKQIVLNTNATITVRGMTYNNVVVVEDQYYSYDEYDYSRELTYQRIYIAQDYGIVKIESGLVGKKPTWTRELVERIKQ